MSPGWVGTIGMALVMVAFVFQIGILLRERRAGGLSVGSSALNMTATTSLFAYAALRGETIFTIVMGFQLAATLTILVLNFFYRNRTA